MVEFQFSFNNFILSKKLIRRPELTKLLMNSSQIQVVTPGFSRTSTSSTARSDSSIQISLNYEKLSQLLIQSEFMMNL